MTILHGEGLEVVYLKGRDFAESSLEYSLYFAVLCCRMTFPSSSSATEQPIIGNYVQCHGWPMWPFSCFGLSLQAVSLVIIIRYRNVLISYNTRQGLAVFMGCVFVYMAWMLWMGGKVASARLMLLFCLVPHHILLYVWSINTNHTSPRIVLGADGIHPGASTWLSAIKITVIGL